MHHRHRYLIRLCVLLVAVITLITLPSHFAQSEPARTVADSFCDTFDGSQLNSSWQWVNPLGDATYSLTEQPGDMRLTVPRGGYDLYSNYNAPRLLRSVSGDFTATTKVTIDPTFNYQGAGLLVWQDENNYIRLERTLVSGIDLWYKTAGVYAGKEISFNSSNTVFLRLQRADSTVTAWYSLDNTNWEYVFAVTNPSLSAQVQVGLALTNQWQDNPIHADFDFFQLNSCGSLGIAVEISEERLRGARRSGMIEAGT
ncbi:MAG: DUF1349 domain-containing protein [Chloroflexales bacterium]|nr:DUF1349 domain-containing protein [Chloroflexales bacterium]